MTNKKELDDLKEKLSWEWTAYDHRQESMYHGYIAIHKLEEKIKELEDGLL